MTPQSLREQYTKEMMHFYDGHSPLGVFPEYREWLESRLRERENLLEKRNETINKVCKDNDSLTRQLKEKEEECKILFAKYPVGIGAELTSLRSQLREAREAREAIRVNWIERCPTGDFCRFCNSDIVDFGEQPVHKPDCIVLKCDKGE